MRITSFVIHLAIYLNAFFKTLLGIVPCTTGIALEHGHQHTGNSYSSHYSSEHFSGDVIQRKLQRAVMRLPDKQRAVFNMKYFDGMKYEDMSTVTGTSVGALKSSYHIAVKKIEAWVTTDQTKGVHDPS